MLSFKSWGVWGVVSHQTAQIGKIEVQVSEKDATIARLEAELAALNSRRHFSGPQ